MSYLERANFLGGWYSFTMAQEGATCWWWVGIFPNTFLQLVNSGKNSVLNWVMKLNLFLIWFKKKPWTMFHSIHLFLLFLWFRYFQKHIKESCFYLSSQLFLETPHNILKLEEQHRRVRRKEWMHFPVVWRSKFQKFSLWFLPWVHLTEIVN